MKFAKRIEKIQSSPAMVLDAKAKELKSQGVSVINLSAGEPDFETPDAIKKAAIAAIEQGFTRYTKSQGIDILRQKISEKFLHENNIAYDPSQVIVGTGSKQLFYTAFQVLCNPDDEVIIPTPTWISFVEQVKLAGGVPVLVQLPSPFKLSASHIEKAITSKTKVLVINTPNNPSGMTIEKEELEKIAKLAIKYDFLIITDEMYEKLLYTGEHISLASLSEEIKDRTLTVNGASKTYAMTGWRIGYAGGPKELIRQMTLLQSQMITNVNSISQMAALSALSGHQGALQVMLNEYTKRREYLIDEFSSLKEFSFIPPDGAFYLFISLEKVLGSKYKSAVAWCEDLLEQEKVVVVPGEAFLYPGYFRMSFAGSMEDLKEAVVRIKRFIA